jgi:uncharacterized damage-inducible protein DinB
MQQQFEALAAYHAAMNRQFYAACGELSAEQLAADQRVFFGSVIGTLNHMLLTDQVWLATFQGTKYAFESLDQILFTDLDSLREAREITDNEIAVWVSTLTEAQLQEGFHDRLTFPLWMAVTHFFNHQTHHRGQLSALLSQMGVDYGTTDLPWVPEAAAIAGTA